jgi:hypothetical protein
MNITGRNVMRAYLRERFSSEVTLSPAMVVEFANAAGDNNPIHHDPKFAATTRFGRPTASDPHTTALLLALTASHFSKKGAMLGLEFWVRFRFALRYLRANGLSARAEVSKHEHLAELVLRKRSI